MQLDPFFKGIQITIINLNNLWLARLDYEIEISRLRLKKPIGNISTITPYKGIPLSKEIFFGNRSDFKLFS